MVQENDAIDDPIKPLHKIVCQSNNPRVICRMVVAGRVDGEDLIDIRCTNGPPDHKKKEGEEWGSE